MADSNSIQALHQVQLIAGPVLNVWLLVFCRVITFIHLAPILNRKDIPFNIKLALGIFLTTMLTWTIPKGIIPTDGSYWLVCLMNIFLGGLVGMTLDNILQVAISAGGVLNNQMGLSSANILDPSLRRQTALMESLFLFIVGLVFIDLGGLHWVIDMLAKSFTVFPLESSRHELFHIINFDYFIMMSGNTLKVSIEMMAPTFIGTLMMDVLLGIVNKAAQQIPVFQLSASVKPIVGMIIFVATLPFFIETLKHYFIENARLF